MVIHSLSDHEESIAKVFLYGSRGNIPGSGPVPCYRWLPAVRYPEG